MIRIGGVLVEADIKTEIRVRIGWIASLERIERVILSLAPQVVLEGATERRVHAMRQRLARIGWSHGAIHPVRRKKCRFRAVRVIQ